MYYNEENKYKKDRKTTIEYTSKTGLCDFICHDCEIMDKCSAHDKTGGASKEQRKEYAEIYCKG